MLIKKIISEDIVCIKYVYSKLPGMIWLFKGTDQIHSHFSQISKASILFPSSFYLIPAPRSFLIICPSKQYSSSQKLSLLPATKDFLAPGLLVIPFLLDNALFCFSLSLYSGEHSLFSIQVMSTSVAPSSYGMLSVDNQIFRKIREQPKVSTSP